MILFQDLEELELINIDEGEETSSDEEIEYFEYSQKLYDPEKKDKS